jgi:NADH-quinone oxidoreductase subunit C
VAEQLPETAETVAENPLKTLGAAIAAAAPQGAVTGFTLARGGAELAVHANRDQLLALMLMLRDDPRFSFEQCMDICGVDWPERAERFEVVYNLLSLAENRRIRVDMYGVVFAGQPDLRRLLTDYGFEGHPLRKDFPLTGHVEVRYDSEQQRVVYGPVTLQQDFRSFDFLSPWEGMTTLPGDEKVHLNRLEGPA